MVGSSQTMQGISRPKWRPRNREKANALSNFTLGKIANVAMFALQAKLEITEDAAQFVPINAKRRK